MSSPTERPAPPHSPALDALIAGHRVDPPPPEPEPADAEPPPAVTPAVAPTLPAVSHLAAVATTSPAAAVFQAAPGDRRTQLRQRAAERSRQRRGVSA